jgi:hypothetical protein
VERRSDAITDLRFMAVGLRARNEAQTAASVTGRMRRKVGAGLLPLAVVSSGTIEECSRYVCEI